MNPTHKNVALLSTCQALLFTNNVTLIAINGLAGYVLAPSKTLATMTVTTPIIGSALATMPASSLMQKIGRRAGFQIGTAFGVVGATIATLAIWMANFWRLCFGTFVLGADGALGGFYRFAAADAAPVEFCGLPSSSVKNYLCQPLDRSHAFIGIKTKNYYSYGLAKPSSANTLASRASITLASFSVS